MADPQVTKNCASEPKLLSKEDLSGVLWWVGGGALAAGVLASARRLFLGAIVFLAISAIAIIVVVILNWIDRALWRREQREPPK